jgi:hypothetical protein
MSHNLNREADGLGIVVAFSGIVKADEVDKIQEQIHSDELFPKLRYQIWDFSAAEDIIITIDEIQHFAMRTAAASGDNPKMRIAIIPRKTSHNILGKTFHTFENLWGANESKSFQDIDDARDWCSRRKK